MNQDTDRLKQTISYYQDYYSPPDEEPELFNAPEEKIKTPPPKKAELELPAFAAKIFALMCLGLTVTYLTALLMYSLCSDFLTMEHIRSIHDDLFAFIATGGMIINIWVGAFLADFVNKKRPAMCLLLHLGYSFLSGITIGPVLILMFSGKVLVSFLILAAAFGVMAIFALVTRLSLSGFFPTLIFGGITIGCYTFYAVYTGVPADDIKIIAVAATFLTLFAATRGYDIRRYYERFPDNKTNMNKTAIIAAIGMYVSTYVVILGIASAISRKHEDDHSGIIGDIVDIATDATDNFH